MAELPYTVFSLGDVHLHQLHTAHGKFFLMSEVAQQLFNENPSVFAKELRMGRYHKVNTQSGDVFHTANVLGLPGEPGNTGITMLTADTVETLLTDRRQAELVQPFRLALLKLASQEAARLMAAGEYELALPVALDAVKQGQELFRPAPALQLFPLYLLAAQANLGLKRAKQCEDFLGLSSWLALKEPEATTNVMRSQLSRLFGQLYALQGQHDEALQAFAEDVYYCAQEYGPEDVRTSLGYYNLSKVFQSRGQMAKSLAFNDMVMHIWSSALKALVLGEESAVQSKLGPNNNLPLGRSQLLEVVAMLQDICSLRTQALGPADLSVGDAHFTSALALIHNGESLRAKEQLDAAFSVYRDVDEERVRLARAALSQLQNVQPN
mmetsp:Transcript_425/g.577  ORF Transcript_425/g.577 Transcript_425/m.577 type:complete len:381 (-) Transcript_425:18-1160(-)|eukprot:CAMPEP_0196588314 /NCGR_PEP_ID=MMETSP1081-20130531/60250_1 /TAXON_ID=36882 /ORGANISM="Pyramimonas amylifera, Strain CCMP720" /LENGTH=380 /DNA_ID=CAMNT_0041910783 /DNA_START=66 /DNA_END=1208 /DNA_ORIENTATION=-